MAPLAPMVDTKASEAFWIRHAIEVFQSTAAMCQTVFYSPERMTQEQIVKAVYLCEAAERLSRSMNYAIFASISDKDAQNAIRKALSQYERSLYSELHALKNKS